MKLPLFLCLTLCCYPIFIQPMEEAVRTDQPTVAKTDQEKQQEQIAAKTAAIENLKLAAKQKYEDASLFKESRTQKYIERASKLNTLTLTALNDPESLKTMDLNQLRDILSRIETRIPIENQLPGFLFGGVKSGTFIKDLESLKTKVLNEINNPRIQADLLQKKTFEKEKSDAKIRAAQREAALPGTIQGYLSDSSFESINSLPGQKPSEKFTPQNIADQKATVLESQLAQLTAKQNKTPVIEKEIQAIKDELNNHYQNLYSQADRAWYSIKDDPSRVLEFNRLFQEKELLNQKLHPDSASKPIAPKVVTQPNEKFTKKGQLAAKSRFGSTATTQKK